MVQRRTGQLFALTPDGRRLDFATTRNGSFLRGLAFAPVTPETRKAGIAGDLFLILVSRSLWLLNEVVRVSGPFDDWVRQEASRPTPLKVIQARPRPRRGFPSTLLLVSLFSGSSHITSYRVIQVLTLLSMTSYMTWRSQAVASRSRTFKPAREWRA